jgi:hypothetical protein
MSFCSSPPLGNLNLSPIGWLDVSTWTFNPVDTVSLEVVLAEMGRFKATQRSLSTLGGNLPRIAVDSRLSSMGDAAPLLAVPTSLLARPMI